MDSHFRGNDMQRVNGAFRDYFRESLYYEFSGRITRSMKWPA
ncbi:MAG: hypothetical protein ACP5M0_11845 [Desulfomonilaceae bacterium]